MKRSVILAALLALSAMSLSSSRTFTWADGAEDWITINKDYSSPRYVDLDQITPANVGELKEVCEIELNEPVWFSSGLLKVGRTLYVTTLRGTYAFDAATCELRWRHVIDFKQTIAAAASRGAGYLEGRIFRGTADGRVIALDAKTGQELWRFDTTLGAEAGGGFWTTYSLDPKTGDVLWKYNAESQAQAGLVPTKSGLLLAGDTHGNLLALDVKSGSVLKRIDVKGALNSGLISYGVDGEQYVAATVGGPTKSFLSTVTPPMPHLYPGLVEEKEVEMIAEALKTSIFKCGQPQGQSCEPPGEPRTGGTPEWQAIYSVLTYPRCINCHPGPQGDPQLLPGPAWAFDYPRQADDRHPHLYGVVRGAETDNEGKPDNKGAPYTRCETCHGTENNPTTGIPGAKHEDGTVAWQLAPKEMAWESAPGMPMTGAELCAQLKDPARNGGRDLEALLVHMETEPLVLWAWNPGTRPNGEARTTPPLSHEDLVTTFEAWINAGAPCPAQ
jgi:PQQ enzyme repeat/PQQ-like domain